MPPAPEVFASVNLKLLQTFLLVGEHSSFRAAAEKSFRSQSAVSAQIRQLESQLGVVLFHRTTRNVRLTAEGQQLLECARRAMREMEMGLRIIREAADLRRGRVSLACSPTIAATRLARALAKFERANPGIEIFVRELTSTAIFESVRKGEVDFGIGPVIETSEFHFETVLEEPLYALVPRRFIRTDRSTIALSTLANMPLLLMDPAAALRSLIEDTMRERNLTFTNRFQFTQAQTLISMAEAGMGAAILPEVALPPRPSASTYVLRIVDPPLMRRMALITMRGQALSPASQRLVELLREFLGPAERPGLRRRSSARLSEKTA